VLGEQEELKRYHALPPCSFLDSPVSSPSSAPSVGDPLSWWKEHEAKYPRLATLARRFLSVMATSVPSERVFSKSGWIANKRRCSLSDEKLSLLTFISCNKHHL